MKNELVSKYILVCDDDPMARAFTVRVLRSVSHFDTSEVGNGQRAIEMILQKMTSGHPFHLVLIDWNMPGMTGLEVISHLKKIEEMKGLPFIITSAETDSEKILEVLDLGISDYLKKPFEAGELLKKVERVLGQRN